MTNNLAIPNCGVCDKAAKLIFQVQARRSNDDCYLECDECLEAVCQDCSDIDEESGTVICTLCLQQSALTRLSG